MEKIRFNNRMSLNIFLIEQLKYYILSSDFINKAISSLGNLNLEKKFINKIKSKKSIDIVIFANNLPKRKVFGMKLWQDYLFHYSMVEHYPIAPSFVHYFLRSSTKDKEKIADKILKIKAPAKSKIKIFQNLYNADKSDAIILSLGVFFYCELCKLEQAEKLIRLIRKSGQNSIFTTRASLRYESSMLDCDLYRPRDFDQSFVLGLVIRKLSAAKSSFQSRNGILHILPSLAPGGAQKQFVNLMAEIRHRFPDRKIYALPMSLETERKRFYRLLCSELDIHVLDPGEILDDIAPNQIFNSSAIVSKWIDYLHFDVKQHFMRVISAIYLCRPQTVHAWTDKCITVGGVAALVAGVENIVLGTRGMPPKLKHHRYDMQSYYNSLTHSPRVKLITNSLRAKHSFIDYLDETANEIDCIDDGFLKSAADRYFRLYHTSPPFEPEHIDQVIVPLFDRKRFTDVGPV